MEGVRYSRNFFLRTMSVIYLLAFISLYVQIPGLYGNNGILPARTQLDSKAKTLSARIHNKPTLLWLAPYVGLDTEYMMDVLALLGIFLSFTGFISQKFCTAPMFAGLWSLYFSLKEVGQTFMWFQWDSLLLEAGALCVLVAPVRYWRRSRGQASDVIPFWLVRWLLFRLIFSSGIVKLTSGCPTWWNLSALSVHFESQCLPTPASWYAHQLPPWLLKLAVVGTYTILIPVPLLFFIPIRSVRVVGFYLEVFLQFAIMITGNYNFFNLLAIVLSISLLDDNFFYVSRGQKKQFLVSRILYFLVNAVIFGGLGYLVWTLFALKISPANTIESTITFSKKEFHENLGLVLPWIVIVAFASLLWTIIQAISKNISDQQSSPFTKFRSIIVTVFYSLIAVFIFGISTVPFSTLHPTGNSTVLPEFRLWHDRLNHLQLTSSYGLFRRMTGVGGRPEIVIEGSDHIQGPWREYHFIYKPTDLNGTLSYVAPHQPRLDWQMWFAALGTYHQNPWLMSLAYRILTGQPEVLDLLDVTRNPTKPPKYLKATLYHYHYTGWDKRFTHETWTREHVSEYFPIFSKDHTPLIDYLKNLRILEPEGHAKPAPVHPGAKYLLDQFRLIHHHVSPPILILSITTSGVALILSKISSRK